MDFLQRRLLMGVLSIAKHPILTLIVVAMVLFVCVGLALQRLTISSNQNELFSSKVDFFHNYLEFTKKFPENEAIYIVIEPTEFSKKIENARWTDAADAIADRLNSEALRPFVKQVDAHVPLDLLKGQGLLFQDPAKVPLSFAEAKQQMVPLAKIWGEEPGGIQKAFGDSPMEQFLGQLRLAPLNDQTTDFVATLSTSWTKTIRKENEPVEVGNLVPDIPTEQASDPSLLGYYYVPNDEHPDQFRLLVRVFPRDNYTSLTAVTHTVKSIRDAAVQAAKPFPEFTIGVTGRPALDADEMELTNHDSHKAEIVALIIVFIGMALMLRSIWLAVAAEIALCVGIGWTFGWAAISEGKLNLLSLVFMIALIGIGMDYLVQILMRYRLEARRYTRADAIWVRVFKHVGPPINTACLGAAGAFLVSTLTQFKGAAELGIIAGGGLVLCLAAGYTVLPAILTLWPPKLKPMSATSRFASRPRLEKMTRLMAPAAWCVALLAASPYLFQAQFHPGLIELQPPDLESVKLIRTLQTWSAVVLVPNKDLAMLRQVRAAVEHLPTVERTESILSAYDNLDWLQNHASEMPEVHWATPPPLSAGDMPRITAKATALADAWSSGAATQPSRDRAVKSLRDFVSTVNSAKPEQAALRLSQWQNVFAGELQNILAPFHPEPLNLAKVPIEVRGHFVSADGDYALYILPKANLWKQENLKEFTEQVENAVAKIPRAPPVTGIASDVFNTTGAIRTAFYQATTYALALIFLLVFLDFRSITKTLLAISVLALGLPMLVSIMGAFNVNWNFANFFGLPILIGAGHEYGVFMVHRYMEAKKYPKRVWKRWDASDRALLLCAFVTFSSFGFFWLLAHHLGLKSLGMVMSLGTACIYLATVSVLRPVLKYMLGRQIPPA